MRHGTWMPLLVALGCSGGGKDTPEGGDDLPTDGTTVEDTDTTELPTITVCELEVASTVPEAGATDAYYRTTIEFWVEGTGAEGATVTVLDGGGSEVSGSTTTVPQNLAVRVVFTPDAPLATLEDYTATLSSPACDDAVLDFTTSDVGEEVLAADLLDRAWSFRLHEARWLEPEGLGAILQTMNIELALGVVAVNGTLLDIVAATSEVGGPDQELCVPTVPFDDPVDYADSPFFSAGPADMNVDMGFFGIIIDDMVVTGAFNPDATRIEGATLEGLIDLRPLVPGLSIAEDADELCAVLALASITCGTCLDGQPYCLDAIADSLVGTEDDPVVVRTEQDILADPLCTP